MKIEKTNNTVGIEFEGEVNVHSTEYYSERCSCMLRQHRVYVGGEDVLEALEKNGLYYRTPDESTVAIIFPSGQEKHKGRLESDSGYAYSSWTWDEACFSIDDVDLIQRLKGLQGEQVKLWVAFPAMKEEAA